MLVKKKHNKYPSRLLWRGMRHLNLIPLQKLKKKWSFCSEGTPEGIQIHPFSGTKGSISLDYITKNTFLKNQSNQLIITLNCNGDSQIKDIYFSVTAIEKLICKLNRFYTKTQRVNTYSTLGPRSVRQEIAGYIPPFDGSKWGKGDQGFWDSQHRRKKQIDKYKYIDLPRCLEYSTTLLRCRKPKKAPFANQPDGFDINVLFDCLKPSCRRERRKSKSEAFFKEHNNYANRWFFKWSENLGGYYLLNKNITQKLRNSRKLFTVIRSPFVFKKTREQFCLQKISYSITIRFLSPAQKDFLIQALRLLKLPVELKLIDND